MYVHNLALFNSNELINKLKNEEYDLLLTEIYDGCGVGLGHFLNIKATVGFIATPLMDNVLEIQGIPQPPSFVSSKS